MLGNRDITQLTLLDPYTFPKTGHNRRFPKRVIYYLEAEDESATFNMAEVAPKLYITSNTLRSKLVDEGTSVKK